MTEAALFRLLINPAVAGRSFSASDVAHVLAGVRTDPRWRWLPDSSTLADPVIGTATIVGHRQVTDMHLVNLAARNGVVLATFDAGTVEALTSADRRHVRLLPL